MKVFVAAIAVLATLASAYEENAPSLVGCPSLTAVLALAGSPDVIQPVLKRALTRPHPLTCEAYLECGTERNGNLRPALQRCPEGSLFDSVSAECTQPLNATCGPTLDVVELRLPAEHDSRCNENSNYTQFLPHESECSKFYICDHGKAHLFECPEGLHFNVELNVCDWPHHANCDSGCDLNEPPVCPSQKLLPHEFDCGKFYQCAHNEPMLMHCPAGLNFSPSLQVCDWPWREQCRLCGGTRV